MSLPFIQALKKKKNLGKKIKPLPLLVGAFWVLHGCRTKSNINVTSGFLGCLYQNHLGRNERCEKILSFFVWSQSAASTPTKLVIRLDWLP